MSTEQLAGGLLICSSVIWSRETHYLLSGSSDGAIMAWKIGSGIGKVNFFCFTIYEFVVVRILFEAFAATSWH